MFVRVLHRPASRLRACPPRLLISSRSPQDLLLVGLTAGRGFSFVSWRTQPSVPFQAPGHAAAFDLRARLAYPRRRPRIRTEPTDRPTVAEGIALVRPYVSVSTMQQSKTLSSPAPPDRSRQSSSPETRPDRSLGRPPSRSTPSLVQSCRSPATGRRDSESGPSWVGPTPTCVTAQGYSYFPLLPTSGPHNRASPPVIVLHRHP
jgi:hypothetical protein